jgi:hypothetical protein
MERLKRVNGQDSLRPTPSFCLKKTLRTQTKRIGLWEETWQSKGPEGYKTKQLTYRLWQNLITSQHIEIN